MEGMKMFNRKLEIGMVKRESNPATTPEEAEANLEAKVTIVTRAVEHGLRKVGMVVFGYVILDTVRQVVVASSKK